MRQYKQEYKNLFKTIPDLQKSFYIIKHYIDKINESKTGCFFIYNLDMLLYNITVFKNILKRNTKKAENVLYYPFYNASFPKLVLNDFKDYQNNEAVKQAIDFAKCKKLISNINLSIDKLNSQKLSKDEICEIFDKFEKTLWVLNKYFKVYVKEYEKQFEK